ncbi:MAG TPA: hypothetical protein VGO61_01105 [Steroidobacteraceae bacterium]|jgi:hypothetical protein|nr:hypothetical protein [Steroidobacteraceae bacterium]
MKTLLLTAGVALALGGCASTTPQLAWGKAGVSKVDYGTDVGMCTGLAAMQGTGDGANTAGGINGKNNSAGGGGSGQASPDASIPAGGSYSGMASADFAQRAATQQRTAEMAAQRARAERLSSCLVERGYKEFALTAEQAAHLATLQKGSNDYHEYLYKLGSDAEVVGKQSRMPVK